MSDPNIPLPTPNPRRELPDSLDNDLHPSILALKNAFDIKGTDQEALAVMADSGAFFSINGTPLGNNPYQLTPRGTQNELNNLLHDAEDIVLSAQGLQNALETLGIGSENIEEAMQRIESLIKDTGSPYRILNDIPQGKEREANLENPVSGDLTPTQIAGLANSAGRGIG